MFPELCPIDQPWEGFDQEGDLGDERIRNRSVSDDMLKILSLWQLQIYRNSYYAAHGKIFNNPALDGYFRSQRWYKPKIDFKETDLSDTERLNVKKIKEYEKKIK